MTDDLEQQLEELGRGDTPRPDGAFANRLEVSLRERMLEQRGVRRPLVAWLRPGVLVVGAAAALIVGALLVSDPDPEVGFADRDSTTTIAPDTTIETTTTTVDSRGAAPTTAGPTTQPGTRTPATTVPDTTAPQATDPDATSPPTTAPATTISNTTIPNTTTPDTTTPDTTTPDTIVPEPSVALTIRRTDRAIVASWTVDGDVPGIVGWVLIRSTGGDGDVVATSREVSTRRFRATITDLDQTFRIEGRGEGGAVIIASDEVSAP